VREAMQEALRGLSRERRPSDAGVPSA